MKKIRVLIIEDSDVVRLLLEEIIKEDPRLEVAASASSAEEGLELLRKIPVDVVSLDIRLPGMNGFEATKKIMSEQPTPIVVVSASVEKEDLKISINALKEGALSIVEKPVGVTRANYQEMATSICTQLAIMSAVKVIRQRPQTRQSFRVPSHAATAKNAFDVLGIVASTGGPNALEKLLKGLPKNFPLPIVVIQHITASFLEGFAAWLADVSPFPVHIAQDGKLIEPGCIYLPPADRHCTFRSQRLWTDQKPPVSNQRPSGTVLFESMATALGPKALGILLTGMGDDGAKGLLEIKKAGGFTIVEDESTAVVYGMPGAAVRLGAACETLPLLQISTRILELVS